MESETASALLSDMRSCSACYTYRSLALDYQHNDSFTQSQATFGKSLLIEFVECLDSVSTEVLFRYKSVTQRPEGSRDGVFIA